MLLREFHLNFYKFNFAKGSMLGTVGMVNPYHDVGPVYENRKFWNQHLARPCARKEA